jgi:hypothetical protein
VSVYVCLLRICCLATDVVSLSVRGLCLETNVVSEPYASNGCFSGSTVLALSKYEYATVRISWHVETYATIFRSSSIEISKVVLPI